MILLYAANIFFFFFPANISNVFFSFYVIIRLLKYLFDSDGVRFVADTPFRLSHRPSPSKKPANGRDAPCGRVRAAGHSR